MEVPKKWREKTISRILSFPVIAGRGSHLSEHCVTTKLMQPTRMRLGRTTLHQKKRILIWPCSVRGLPVRLHHCKRRCALTAPFHPCPERGGLLSVALSVGLPKWLTAFALRSALFCGVRTFLSKRSSCLFSPALNFQILSRTLSSILTSSGISNLPQFSQK